MKIIKQKIDPSEKYGRKAQKTMCRIYDLTYCRFWDIKRKNFEAKSNTFLIGWTYNLL